MSFLSPIAFALALLLPIIIAMYLLRLRRTEQTVSSTYLWQRMVRDVEANAPWQRLRRNLLLLLQLLFLIFLILALARPFQWVQGATSQTVIFVIDSSASMAATDLLPSRMEAAKAQMQRQVDTLPGGARATLIVAGQRPQVIISHSQDRRQLRQAIENLQPSLGVSNLKDAFALASAIGTRQADVSILLYSDFAHNLTLPAQIGQQIPIRYFPVGTSDDNQAITTVNLQENSHSDDERVNAFIQVANYSEQPSKRRLTLSIELEGDSEELQLFNVYNLTIPPQDQAVVVVDDLPSGVEWIQAELEGEDILALDDVAWAVVDQQEPTQVNLISPGNRFLETALALLPNTDVIRIAPTDFEQANVPDPQSESTPQSLTILDAYLPLTTTMPTGNLLLISPPRSTEYFSITGIIETPQPLAGSGRLSEQILAHVNLAEVNILQSLQLALPDWAEAVIIDESGGQPVPLFLAGEPQGRRMAVLSFDLRDSDLPLQTAFPLLLANVVNWLAVDQAGQLPPQVEPSTLLAFVPPPQANQVTVTQPNGNEVRLQADGGGQIRFDDTGALGIYTVAWSGSGGKQVLSSFVVNFSAPQESRVKPQGIPTLADRGKEVSNLPADEQLARREWWRWLAFLALALLCMEWVVYHRSTLVKLGSYLSVREQG